MVYNCITLLPSYDGLCSYHLLMYGRCVTNTLSVVLSSFYHLLSRIYYYRVRGNSHGFPVLLFLSVVPQQYSNYPKKREILYSSGVDEALSKVGS